MAVGGKLQSADWSKGTLGRRAAAFAGDVRSCPFSRALDDNAATSCATSAISAKQVAHCISMALRILEATK